MTTIILNIDMRYTDAFSEPQRHTLTDVSRILHATGHCAAHQLAMHGDTCVVQFEALDLSRANVNMLTLISRLCRGLHKNYLTLIQTGMSGPFIVGPGVCCIALAPRADVVMLNGERLED